MGDGAPQAIAIQEFFPCPKRLCLSCITRTQPDLRGVERIQNQHTKEVRAGVPSMLCDGAFKAKETFPSCLPARLPMLDLTIVPSCPPQPGPAQGRRVDVNRQRIQNSKKILTASPMLCVIFPRSTPRRLCLGRFPHARPDVRVPLPPHEVEQEGVGVEEKLVVRPRHGSGDVPRRVNATQLDEPRVVLDRLSHELGGLSLTFRLDHDAHLHKISTEQQEKQRRQAEVGGGASG